MNVAYLIQCHKNIEQIKLLIHFLELSKNDHAVIHVDAKNVALRAELEKYYYNSKSVSIIHDPVFVSWSGVSQIHATLKMINFLYEKAVDFDYCCLLSGEDLVIDVNTFKIYLSNACEKSFLEYRHDRINYFWRINNFNLFRNNRFSQKVFFRFLSFLIVRCQAFLNIKRKNFSEDEIFLGSQWFTISKLHMDMIYKAVDKSLLKKFEFTSCCDEHFFQILFAALINKEQYECFNLRYVDFSEGRNSPRYLTLDDLKEIRNMNGIFIARKVTCEVMSQYIHYYRERDFS